MKKEFFILISSLIIYFLTTILTQKSLILDWLNFVLKNKVQISITVARGTMDYIAPEMLSTNFGNVSYKLDIYSFGMLNCWMNEEY